MEKVSSEHEVRIDLLRGALAAVAVVLALLVLVVIPDHADAQTAAPVDNTAVAPVTFAGCKGASVTLKQREYEVFKLHNAHRASKGLPQFCLDPALQRAAQKHSDDMAARNFYSHTNPDGKSSFARMTAELGTACATTQAENLGAFWLSETPQAAMDGWLGSSGHRANIENGVLVRVGLGSANDPDASWGSGMYYTVDFASSDCPPPPPPEDEPGDGGTDPGDGDGDGGNTDPADPKPVMNYSAPLITNLSVSGGRSIRDRTPRFNAKVRASQTELTKGNVKVYIDNRLTTRFSYSSATDVLSGVSRKLKAGKRHSIRIVASDGEGRTSSKTTRFVVK